MDTSSSEKDPQNKVKQSSPIVADDLNPYASEFFLVNNHVDKRAALAVKVMPAATEAPKSVDTIVAEVQSIDTGIDKTAEEVVIDCSTTPEVIAATPEPINFWTAPIKYKKETVTVAPNTFHPLSPDLDGCTCQDCSNVTAAVEALSPRPISAAKMLAPFAWTALFVICSVSIISQLIVSGSRSCDEARRLTDGGKYQESLSASSIALHCNPFSAKSYYERARALVHLLSYQEAQECLNNCLALQPDNTAALDARAALSLKVNKPEQTISDSMKLLALSSGHLNGLQYGNLAVAYYKTGRYDDAIHYYDKALAINSKNLQLDLGRSYCLSGKQQHKDALVACDSLIKRYGAKSDILALRGYCLERLHDLAGAQKDFDRALAQDPTNSTFYGYRAALMAELGKPASALSDYIKAANLDRQNADAQWVVAKMLKTMGRDKEALAYYNRLAQFASFTYSFDQHQERAALNYASANYEACLVDLKRAIELEPDCNLHVLKAICCARLGKVDEAHATIAEAYRLRPESPSVVLGDAQVEAILGQTLSAVDKFSQVLAAGDNKEALIGRGQIYFARGQWASAAHDFKRALALGVTDRTIAGDLAHCNRALACGAKIKLDLPAQKIIDMSKDNNLALADKGAKAYQSDDMNVAVIYFNELTRRQPANLAARKNLAHSLEGAGAHEQAISIFEGLSQRNLLAVNDQYCYAHALAANAQYERSITIMERLQKAEPNNMLYRLELVKMLSAAGQTERAIGFCRDSLAMGGSGEVLKSLNNVYESLVTERLRSKKDGDGTVGATAHNKVETEG